MAMKKIPQDIVGDIAILKFRKWTPWLIRKYKAWRFLKEHKNVKTVVEKKEKFDGVLRIPKTSYLAGERTYDTTYKENGATFKFNINKTYFSPRLSQERKLVAQSVSKRISKGKKNMNILVCFAGVAPFPIAIAKELKKQGKVVSIISNELNEDACMYATENVRLNKLQHYIEVVQGDSKKLPKKVKTKFDMILMMRPNLEDTFLKEVLQMGKKGTKIYYHGFGTKEKVLEEIKRDAGKKIGKITIRKAGDIGKDLFRWHAEFAVR